MQLAKKSPHSQNEEEKNVYQGIRAYVLTFECAPTDSVTNYTNDGGHIAVWLQAW